jgi:hypothetical protein
VVLPDGYSNNQHHAPARPTHGPGAHAVRLLHKACFQGETAARDIDNATRHQNPVLAP